MARKSSGSASMSAKSAGKQPTEVKYSSAKAPKGQCMGSKDMGISAYSQKPKNLIMISPMAKTSKKAVKGSDKYS